MRRSNKNSSPDINFDQEMCVTVSQESFLSNQNNKTRFIQYLKEILMKANIMVKQADDDADLLIVKTALEHCYKTPVIVAEDVDVLVLLIALVPPTKKTFFLKPSKGKVASRVYSLKSFNKYPFCKENILFLHAVTGCDTTSSFFGKGKKIAISLMENKSKNINLKNAIEAFKIVGQSHESIFENGITFLLSLYGAPEKTTCIDEYRYVSFAKAVANNTKTLKPVKLESLPPTSDAARQHFYRVYLQVQNWMSNEMSPEE